MPSLFWTTLYVINSNLWIELAWHGLNYGGLKYVNFWYSKTVDGASRHVRKYTEKDRGLIYSEVNLIGTISHFTLPAHQYSVKSPVLIGRRVRRRCKLCITLTPLYWISQNTTSYIWLDFVRFSGLPIFAAWAIL